MLRRRILSFLGGLFLLGLMAAPSFSASLTSVVVTVSSDCKSYTITAKGNQLDQKAVLNYTITLNGKTIGSGKIDVTPESNGTFDVTGTGSLTEVLPSGATLSGVAGLKSLNGQTLCSNGINFKFQGACPPLQCTAPSSNSSNFNGTAIAPGNYIWFNANFQPQGIPKSGSTVFLENQKITFATQNGTSYTIDVPNSQITFSPNVNCATVTFDSSKSLWEVTVPVGGDDEVFLSGVAWKVPSGFEGQVKGDVIWSGTFATGTSGVSGNWKWGAAVYSDFTTDYNSVAPKPTHNNSCAYNNGDHAGTPEGDDWKKYVIGGARGGGGSNWTGSWSGTLNFTPNCK